MSTEADLRQVQYVLFDVDNTLVDNASSELPTQRFRDAVARATEAGVRVGLATARQEQKALHIIRACGMSGYSILMNGAQVYDAATDTYAVDYQLSVPRTLTLMRDLEELQLDFWVQDGGVDHFWTGEISDDGLGIYSTPGTVWETEPDPEVRIRDYIPDRPYIVIAQGLTATQRTQLLRKGEMLAGNHTTALTMHETLTKDGTSTFSVAFLDDRATKAQAVKTLIELTKTSKAEWMMVGDSHNDVAVMEQVGVGVAVANAVPEVKQAAVLQVASWADDGAAEALERVIAAKLK